MFEKITPEEAGISSGLVEKLIKKLNQRGLQMHSLLLMKGDKLFGEYYWAPFNKDFVHRSYSQTKSYTAIAIGLLEEDGKLNLDDPICKYFPEKYDGELPENLKNQTIREMLTMTTVGENDIWFNTDYDDRTEMYFKHKRDGILRSAGTIWEYDSAGSQVLASLVDKLSGMRLFDFLNERIFKHLGTFKDAYVLKTRNGDSWGDSAMVCTTRDTVSFARFVMNYGTFGGKRLMNENFLKQATSPLVDNTEFARPIFMNGYGYQIWGTEMGGFCFNGMGSQYCVCIPSLDLIFACHADTQGYVHACDAILGYFFDLIAENMSETALPADPEAYNALEATGSSLELFAITGSPDSPFRSELDGAEYECLENPMGWSRFSFSFAEDGKSGVLHYTNAQGSKDLKFGINYNEFGKFPQLGYSNEFGGVPTTDGFMMDVATSAAWREEKKLVINYQIIDKYFGNGKMFFAFKGDNATVYMAKAAEDFLKEYVGIAVAKKK